MDVETSSQRLFIANDPSNRSMVDACFRALRVPSTGNAYGARSREVPLCDLRHRSTYLLVQAEPFEVEVGVSQQRTPGRLVNSSRLDAHEPAQRDL